MILKNEYYYSLNLEMKEVVKISNIFGKESRQLKVVKNKIIEVKIKKRNGAVLLSGKVEEPLFA